MTSGTIGSSAAVARGVNTRLTRARSRSCLGGSIMMMVSKDTHISSLDSVDRSTPWADEKVSQSLWARHTSS